MNALVRWIDPARSREILALAGPIVVAMSSQIVLNLVDTAMVGRLGPAPQAAAGLGSFTFLVLANLVIAVGTGVQATSSRYDGAGDRPAAGAALDTGLLLAVGIGLPLGYLLAQAAPAIFGLLTDDSEVATGGGGYLAIRLMGLGAVASNFAFRGFYNGIGRSRVYMSSVILIQVTNIFLNWVFIFGNLGAAPMGVRGAALASVLAAVVGVVFYSVLTLVQAEVRATYRPMRFASLSFDRIRRMVRIAWPDALRGILTMFGFLLFLDLHEALGTRAAAAGTILINIASAGFLPALGFGLAGSTMVGRHLGRNDPDEARKMVWAAVRMAVVVLVLPMAILILFPVPVLQLFTQDGPVIAEAVPALRLFSAAAIFDALPIVLIFSLMGAGATRWVAGVQVVQQYVLLLPLAWLLGLGIGWGVFGLWIGMLLSRAALAGAAVKKFQGDSWTGIQV